ncbi:MAG: sulfatase-like hydrolase/transferase [Opitutales bacterium]
MKNYPILYLLAVVSTLFGFSSLQAQSPNIVVIVCDDLNDTIEGIGGHPQAYTPNITRLMESGVRFTNAASNAPICGPSRASLWSGIHPVTSGMYGQDQQTNRWDNNVVLRNKKTLFETFIDQGYYSYATGKIHHNGHESSYSTIMRNTDGSSGYGTKGNFGPYPNTSTPQFQGVDPSWWGDGYKDNVTPPYSGFGYYRDLSSYGHQWTLQSGGSNNASYTTWNYDDNGTPNDFSDDTRDLTSDEISAQQAVNFINGYDKNKPFLLTVGFVRPHSPYYAPKEFFDLVPALNEIQLAPINASDYNDITGPVNSTDKDLAQNSGWWKYTQYKNMGIAEYGDAERALKEFTQAYLACVAFVDAQVGKVMDAIDNSNDPTIRDNTILIFTSDHGYHLGEKSYIFKQSPWEESVRVPLVIAGPGVAANQECNKPVSLVDIYPTCIDYAGLNAPHTLDGYSMRAYLADPQNGQWDGPSYSVAGIGSSASVSQNQVAPYTDQHFSIRSEQFRYILYRDGEEELYDHSTDPNEWSNVVGASAYADTLATMQSYYRIAVGLEEPPPDTPAISFLKPTSGEAFYPNEPIEVEAQGNASADLSRISFYVDNVLIKTDAVAPYTAKLYDRPEGDYTLSAVGEQNDGAALNAALAFTVGASGTGTNLITNPGFENSTIGSISNESQLAPFNYMGPADRSITNSYAYAGSQSLLISNRTQNYSGIRYLLDDLTLGNSYQIACRLRLSQSNVLAKLTRKNTASGTTYSTVAQATYINDWVELSGTFVATEGDESIYIGGVPAGVDIYVDDFSLVAETPGVNPSDTDQDGIPDSWEVAYFGSNQTSPDVDSDMDGLSNRLEYRSGTIPTNANSRFAFNSLSAGETSNEISWFGSDSVHYRVLSKTDLAQSDWQVEVEALPGTFGGLNYWTETHQGIPNKFYKVQIDE